MATKWNKADFMKAFHANSGTKHHNWVNFHAAMSRASKDAGAGRTPRFSQSRRSRHIGSSTSRKKQSATKAEPDSRA